PRTPRARNRTAHGHCQYPSAERADADDRAFAWPGHHSVSYCHRDRRQSESAVLKRATGKSAILLLPRYSGRSIRSFLKLRSHAGPIRKVGGSTDDTWQEHFRRRHASREPQAKRGGSMGASKRPRTHLFERDSHRLKVG